MDALWQIDLFGGLRARGEDRTIIRFRTHKTAVLLAHLAFHPKRAPSRDELAGMLWPDSSGSAGRVNLRAELASLRRQLEPPGVPCGSVLVTDRTAVHLNPAAICVDVAEFETALREAQEGGSGARRTGALRRAMGLYQGELLAGWLEEWVLLERGRLADLYVAAARELSRLLREGGDGDGATAAAHQAIAADPLCEEAREDLIRLYAEGGRPAEALRQFHELEQILRDQCGLEPSAPLRQLATDLQNHVPPARAPETKSARALLSSPAPSRGSSPGEDPRTPQPAPRGGPHLPLVFTRFFGREAELACLEALLSPRDEGRGMRDEEWTVPSRPSSLVPHPSRLITLTGPAGSGKTRLAIEAARHLSPSFADRVPACGCWFVPLADLMDPALIPEVLAAAMRLPRSPDVGPIEQVAMFLGDRPCLLVLDNLEHLLEGAREFVRDLLERVPNLVCLVTSRQKLDLEGEREIPVLPLAVPGVQAFRRSGVQGECVFRSPYPAGSTPDLPLSDTEYALRNTPERLNALAACPSVALFIDRAQAARPDFQLTARNAAAVAELCARLEGLPLAIELAAAWAQTVTPAQMLAQLEGCSPLLVSRRKDRPPRHQSLQTAIDWSYRLLEPPLQRFFAQLAVFRGGWDLEAAEAVCSDFGFWILDFGFPAKSKAAKGRTSLSDPIQNPNAQRAPEIQNTLSFLAALQDRSLVVAELAGDAMRYRLLEGVREFARERLSEAEWDELVRRHTAYYLSLAEAAAPRLHGPEQRRWLDRLKADQANLQAALERADGREEGLRLAAALSGFWQLRAQLREGGEWLDRMLSACADAPPCLRARAVFGAAALAYLTGDLAFAESLCEKGVHVCDLLPDAQAVAEVIQPLTTPDLLGICSASFSSPPRLMEALQCGKEDQRVQAFFLARDGKLAWCRGDYAEAAALHDQSLAIYRELGDRQGMAMLLWLRGSVALYRGDRAAVRRYWEESLAIYREVEDQTGICWMTGALGYLAYRQADYGRAESLLQEALWLSRRSGARHDIATNLWLLGAVAGSWGEYDRAEALLEESLEMRRSGPPSAAADTLSTLGAVAQARGDYARARSLQQEALDLRRQGTDRLDVASALVRLGLVAVAEGGGEEAERLFREGLELSREMHNDECAAQALRGLGLAACRQGDLALAEIRMRECLALVRRGPIPRLMADALESLAELRAGQAQAEASTALYAAADALRAAIGAPVPPCDQPRRHRTLASLRAALGEERFAAVWEAARGRDTGDLLMEALEPKQVTLVERT